MIDILQIATECRQGNDGIWYAHESEPLSYTQGGNDECFELEDKSFWFKHRNECIITAIGRFPPGEGEAIFDIGGGNGYVSAGLLAAGLNAVVVEPGPAGAVNARKRGVPVVVCGTTATAGFKPGVIGAIGLFDVVEHVRDDKDFLTAMRRLLRPGGKLYLTVPAYSLLWSHEDVRAGHFRRYTARSICQVLADAGFSILYWTYFFRFLPVPIFLVRSLPFRLGALSDDETNGAAQRRQHLPVNGLGSNLLRGFLDAEVTKIRGGRQMTVGASCLVVAETR